MVLSYVPLLGGPRAVAVTSGISPRRSEKLLTRVVHYRISAGKLNFDMGYSLRED